MPGMHEQGIMVDTQSGEWWFKDTSPTISLLSASEFIAQCTEGELIMIMQDLSLLEADEERAAAEADATPTLPAELTEFADVFDEQAAVSQPPHNEAEHAIETDGPPPYGPIYPQSARELEELRKYISEALANGWIRTSVSPAGSPILFVQKADGSLRLCVDYRGLNKVTIKNRHPLPLIDEIIDRLCGSKVYTKLDLKWAYHRIRIRRGDEWKTAFRTRYGHFEYLVMPFGLTNAPATFQAYINKALGELVDVLCIVYLDDIIIFSREREEHTKHVRAVLARLRKWSLYCNLKKCKFFQTRVEFLGYIVTTEGVEMDPRKVDSIVSWPTPSTFTELQTFLGFCNFYRRFVDGYSQVVSPLTGMLKGSVNGKKEGPFEWGEDAEQAFRKLIKKFTTAPMLVYFDPARRTRIETDASAFAIAAIISQLIEETGQWHPVAYWSRKLIAAEQNYETHDQELLVIVEAFKRWRHYVAGSPHAIEVITDHRNLTGFSKMKQLNGRQARWAMLLSAYDFIITHRAGKLNPADAPSRRPDYAVGEGERAANMMLPTLFSKLRIEPTSDVVSAHLAGNTEARRKPLDGTVRQLYLLPVFEDGEDAQQEAGGEQVMLRSDAASALEAEAAYSTMSLTARHMIIKAQRGSAEAKELRRQLAEDKLNKRWKLIDGVLTYQGRLYVPPVRAVCEELMKRHHDDPYAGHFGVSRTLALLQRKYHWQSMPGDVAAYVKSCDVCQKIKIKRHRPYGEMQALPSPDRPWKEIALDFMSGIPISMRGTVAHDAILVVVDRYSKMALYFPVSKTITAAETADLLIDAVFTRFGFPSGIVSDRDPRFTSDFWSELCYYAKVTRRLSTAFHPQTDGQTERQNQTLQEYLRAFCSLEQTKWAERLPIAEFAYNNSERADLGASPFRVVLGYDPPALMNDEDTVPEGKIPAAKERIQRIHDLRKDLQARLEAASESQAKHYNKRHQPITFQKGQLVLVSTKNLRVRDASKKLTPRFMGPFRIETPVGTQAYRVQLPEGSRIHNVFHVSVLEPYHRREGDQPVLPPPELINDAEEYEVETILDKTRSRGAVWYKVKWKGWPSEYDQWVPQEDLANAKRLVRDFESKQPPAPQKRGRGRPKKQ
jgi:hypothetical protein